MSEGERRWIGVLKVPPVEHELDNGLASPPVALGPVTSRKLREYALVLQSMQVHYELRHDAHGGYLLIADDDRSRAIEAIRLYETENRDWPPRRIRERLPYPRSFLAPAIFLALVAFFFLVTGPVADGSPWFARGRAISDRILHDQPWRAITALTLHADAVHIAGNALSGSIFLSAVNRRLGNGRGTLAVLVAGALGNIANAAHYYPQIHRSIGASTAVFAAVGVLVATQLAVNHRRQGASRTWLERLGPPAAGLVLLGMLGASPESDLTAHLFGFLAGLVIGVPVAFLSKEGRSTLAVQLASGLAVIALVGGSWALAWAR